MEIVLPHAYEPRDYQRPVWEAFDAGYKRLLLIWHRRAGKDKTCINLIARAMMERVGTYFYVFPTYSQGRRVIWGGMDGNGFRFMNHLPKDLIDGKPHETEMRVRFKNGSVFQIVGSDNIDAIMGTNPVGVVLSEYSLQDPAGWNLLRPILRENGGWMLAQGTPRGKANHLYKMYQMAENNPEWYVQKLGVNETGVMTAEDIQSERAAGMDEELIQQEFYSSFEGGSSGAILLHWIQDAERESRITDVPHDESMPVHTAWDLGIDDQTTCIFYQQSPAGQVRIIDYHHSSGKGLAYYVTMLREKANDYGYNYGDHIAPWDVNIREMGTGKSRLEVARGLGLSWKVARKLPFADGINASRMLLPLCWFDREKTQPLVEALMEYSWSWDRQQRCWRDRPLRNWATHGADALRYLAVGRRNARLPMPRDRYTNRYGSGRASNTWMAA